MLHTKKQPNTTPTSLSFSFLLNGGGLRGSKLNNNLPISKNQKLKTKTYFAFTLVELIVVIVILSILATIAFLSFNSYSGRARDSNRLSNLKLTEKGIELYFVNSGLYPTPEGTISTGTINGLDVAYNGVVADRISNMVKLNNTPKDPLTDDYINYGLTSDKTKYQLAVTLEDSDSAFNMDNIIIIEWANASSQYQAKVIGNYLGSLKFSSGATTKTYYLANIPSLIYNSSTQTNTSIDLLSGSSTYYVINKNTNLPYKLATNDTPNKKDGTTLVREVTNSQTAAIGAIDITAIVTETDTVIKNSLIATTFSGANLTNFGGNINAITSVVTGNGGSSSSSSNIPIVNNCTLSGTTINHGSSIDVYSEYSIIWNASYSCNDRKITRTCNNGILSGDESYRYSECSLGTPDRCTASGSFIKNGHTYSIPELNHSVSTTNILSNNISENNGIFKYTLSNIECNDGLYINTTESATPTIVSCNSGYSVSGNSCIGVGSTSAFPGLSCNNIKTLLPSSINGTYWLKPNSNPAFQVYCDMTTDGGGWTLVAKSCLQYTQAGDGWGSNLGDNEYRPGELTLWNCNGTKGGKLSDTKINAIWPHSGGKSVMCKRGDYPSDRVKNTNMNNGVWVWIYNSGYNATTGQDYNSVSGLTTNISATVNNYFGWWNSSNNSGCSMRGENGTYNWGITTRTRGNNWGESQGYYFIR